VDPPPFCDPNVALLVNGDFEFPGDPLRNWTTSSPITVTHVGNPVAEVGVGPFHSVQFNIDYDRCSGTLRQPDIAGLCPNQLYQLEFFMAISNVAPHRDCNVEMTLADQVFWRHKLPYPNLLGTVLQVEGFLYAPVQLNNGIRKGFVVGDSSNLDVTVECKNMTHGDLANVWFDAFRLSPVITIPVFP